MLIKFIKYHISILSLIVVSSISINSSAQILNKKYHLEGHWSFSVGDQEDWKEAGFDHSMWDQIKVGQSWESQGYDDYNGIAWYRKILNVNEKPLNSVYLKIGAIDDADEVYFNGSLIGRKGSFPPNPETAYNQDRMYEIPLNLWKTGKNTIAIRVYDYYLDGGIINNPVAIYEDNSEEYLSYNLAGEWHFKAANSSQFKTYEYNHSNWKTINVPGRWEDQGWEYLDGIAWYRKTFYLPNQINNKELYLVLGRIDDEDVVYLNGEKIGETKNSNGSWNRTAYRELRIYRIRKGLLSSNKPNVIAVKVKDEQLDGGIYEGPIGLVTREQANEIKSISINHQSAWDMFWDWMNN